MLFLLLFNFVWCAGNGNVGVVATDRSYLHLALNQPSMNWLKLPFSPLVTAKAANVPKPVGKKWYNMALFCFICILKTMSQISKLFWSINEHNYINITEVFISFAEATVLDFKQGLVHQIQTYSFVSISSKIVVALFGIKTRLWGTAVRVHLMGTGASFQVS